jgi:hypothetical protein
MNKHNRVNLDPRNPFPNPGPWQQFCIREDNKQLSGAQLKQKFLKEQSLYNKYRAPTIRKTRSGGGTGGGGGVAIDGPIAGALVRSNVGTAVTDASGNFKLPGKATGVITVTGGVDSITGLPYEGELIGYAEYKTISPITTFAHYLKKGSEEDPKAADLTIDEAITKTFVDSFDYFGISLPIEDKDTILQKDYIEESIVNNNKVGISAQAIATQIEAITETVGVALAGSQEAAAATKAGKVIPEFSVANRKRSAYEAFGRAANLAGFSISDIRQKVKFIDPVEQSPTEGVSFENATALTTQLTATKRELATLATQDQYTTNYLTTRIQAVNRAQKTVIKNEAKDAVSAISEFSDINTVSTSPTVEDALNQIEKDKKNETSPTLDGKANEISGGEGAKYFQLRKDEKTGEEGLQQLELRNTSDYYYFGEAKDAPLLLSEGEETYSPVSFTGTTDPGILEAIMPNIPVYVEVTTSTAAFDIKTTYTLRPTQSNEKGEPGIQVTLRLSQITETRTKKAIDHIVTSEVGTYTVTYTVFGGEPISLNTSIDTGDLLGNILNMFPPKGVEGISDYALRRYEKSPSTLLELIAPKVGSVSVQNLVFEDNKLSIAIPASEGQVEATMDITFTLNE